MNKSYSTAEVAKLVGVHKNTLLRWLYSREVPEPAQTIGNDFRVWTEQELEAVKAYKEQNYRKRS
jgi:excisionase family DNA binding protein